MVSVYDLRFLSISELNILDEGIQENFDRNIEIIQHYVKLHDFLGMQRDTNISSEDRASTKFDTYYTSEKDRLEELREISNLLPPTMY